MARQSRLTISVDHDDPRLANTPVSVIVESTNGADIVVERAMWWPGQGNWYEGHLSAGTTQTGTRWALAEGEVTTGPTGVTTYILIANTSDVNGTATVSLPTLVGATPQVVPLPAHSRVNVSVAERFPTAVGLQFSALIESNGVQIVVERAMYSSTATQVWAAGTVALATRLP